ncbi:MAG: MgtC/SapB family protein [Acidimicrobiales bacterium]
MVAAVSALIAQMGGPHGYGVRMLVALGLTFAIGFERELRGSPAGDRTFSLVGLGSAVVGYLALNGAPNALAGVVTGVGFIGAGVIVHSDDAVGMVQGVTTAATIYLAAAIGAAAGQGELLMATEATAISLLILEVRHIRILRFVDGRYWRRKFDTSEDEMMDM